MILSGAVEFKKNAMVLSMNYGYTKAKSLILCGPNSNGQLNVL